MCNCDPWADFSVLLRSGIRKARKHHKCSECTNRIKPGQKYYNEAWLFEGVFTVKTCIPCKRLQEFMIKEFGSFNFESVREDYNELIKQRRNEKR